MRVVSVGIGGREVEVHLCESFTHEAALQFARRRITGLAIYPVEFCEACAGPALQLADRAGVKVWVDQIPLPDVLSTEPTAGVA